MPLRNGAWSARGSAEAMAPQRTASRKASSRSGGSSWPAIGRGSVAAAEDLASGLDLPDDPERLAEPVVLDRGQVQEVLGLGEGAGRELAARDVRDDPEAITDADDVADLGRVADGRGDR